MYPCIAECSKCPCLTEDVSLSCWRCILVLLKRILANEVQQMPTGSPPGSLKIAKLVFRHCGCGCSSSMPWTWTSAAQTRASAVACSYWHQIGCYVCPPEAVITGNFSSWQLLGLQQIQKHRWKEKMTLLLRKWSCQSARYIDTYRL